MPKHKLEVELTLRYSYHVGWRHLNDTLYLFDGRMTTPRRVEVDEDRDGWLDRCVVTLSPAELARAKRAYKVYRAWAKADRAEWIPTFTQVLERATGDYFDRGCRCEHDCCGHVSAYGVAKRIGPRTLSVRVRNIINV
ncbi:hypothetical protein OF001_U20255 [Pseudomonas sp. OF001]|uniref:hypothetical protein n=1 Tax=Pseudomonas sp. OF001 TaxID=2772300 RepID=UPI0019182C85|nr:hypothetical protein [Pseudomonas sp. OF001]CAD5377328.1 hypothetical protein OF001_U20255 [Pseudomonas sp. OF001]